MMGCCMYIGHGSGISSCDCYRVQSGVSSISIFFFVIRVVYCAVSLIKIFSDRIVVLHPTVSAALLCHHGTSIAITSHHVTIATAQHRTINHQVKHNDVITFSRWTANCDSGRRVFALQDCTIQSLLTHNRFLSSQSS